MSARTAYLKIRSTPTIHAFKHPAKRTFITLPGTEKTTIHESRTLPYSASRLYSIISDIDNYTTFLPFCEKSKITKWSGPDSRGKKWPAQAALTVGFKGVHETFTSRLYCVPDRVVEAIGGEATTSLAARDIQHYLDSPTGGVPRANNIFKSLSTKWVLEPSSSSSLTSTLSDAATTGSERNAGSVEANGTGRTHVRLEIQYQFLNPIYGTLVNAAAPKMVGLMIEAFEKRARETIKEDL